MSVEICARDEHRAKQLGGDAADRTYASLEAALADCQPGDIISTGTPPGVGMGMNPQVFLKAGDVMKLGIEGLGEQTQKTIQA